MNIEVDGMLKLQFVRKTYLVTSCLQRKWHSGSPRVWAWECFLTLSLPNNFALLLKFFFKNLELS